VAAAGGPYAVDVLRVRGGRATWQELMAHCTQHELRRALARGEVLQVGRGRYALPEQHPSRELAAAAGGVLSHLSAAVHHGLAVLHRPSLVHVTVPRDAHRACPPGVVLHRADVPPDDRDRLATGVLRTVLDCAATLPFAEGLAVADSALREGLVRPEHLQEEAAGQHRRGAAAAHGDAANPFESALRAVLLDAGLSTFVPQQPIALASGVVVHADLGDPRRRVAVEADSFEHHGSRAALREDCRRYDEMLRVGWTPLRFAWEHVLGHGAWVAGVTRDVWDRAQHVPAASGPDE
jgi:very-short-patch-repair endonuclease